MNETHTNNPNDPVDTTPRPALSSTEVRELVENLPPLALPAAPGPGHWPIGQWYIDIKKQLLQQAHLTREECIPHHPRLSFFAAHNGIGLALGNAERAREETEAYICALTEGETHIHHAARSQDMDLRLYEMDLETPTQNIEDGPAMSEDDQVHALSYGMMAVEPGVDLLTLSTLGAGNTLISTLLLVMTGDGADGEIKASIWNAPDLYPDLGTDPLQPRVQNILKSQPGRLQGLDLLAQMGGYEICALCGAILAARLAGQPVILEGRAGAAALAILQAHSPNAIQHCALIIEESDQFCLNMAQDLNIYHTLYKKGFCDDKGLMAVYATGRIRLEGRFIA